MAAPDFQILTPAEFERELTGVEPAPPVATRPGVPDTDVNKRMLLQRFTPTGEAVPLDTATGVPFLTRLNASLAPDEATREATLQRSFANVKLEGVRLRPGGDPQFVLRDYQDPQTGQVKDLLVDELGASWKDLADLGQVGVEILGAYLLMRGGRKVTGEIAPGFKRGLADSVLAATGGQLTGGASDAIARARVGQPIQPLEIIQRRHIAGAKDIAFDLIPLTAIASGTHIANLRRGVPVTPEAAKAVAVRNQLAEETDVSVPFTLGEQTGSERLRQSEALLQNATFGGGRLRQFKGEQKASIARMQDAIVNSLGPLPAHALPSDEILGGRAIAALRRVEAEAAGATTTARADALSGALDELSSAIEASTGPLTRHVLGSEAGNAVQTFVRLKQDALNEVEDQLGTEVDRLIGGQSFIPTPVLKRDVNNIIAKAYEKPGVAGEVMASMPSTLKPILKDIEDLSSNVNLAGMRRIRHSINRQISQGEILGDTDTGVLKQLSKVATEAIERGTQTLTPEAATALKRYNQFYREGIEGFQVKGITEILADPTQRKLGPGSIFDQAAGSRDQYFRLKDALTKPLILEGQAVGPVEAGNQAWSTFKQAMWQEMWDGSRKTGNKSLVDPKKLLGKLGSLKADVREDLLGPQADVAMRALGRLEVLDNPKLPAEEALVILRQGGDTAPQQILDLAKREADLDKLYANQEIKRYVKGQSSSDNIRPGELLDRFADSAPLADVRDALNKLELEEPGITLVLRQKKAQSIFESAQRSPLEDQASAKKLASELRAPSEQARLELLLGKPGLTRMQSFLDVLAHIDRPGQRGSLVGPGEVAKIVTLTGLAAALPKQIRFHLSAMLLTNPKLYRLATHPVQPLDPTKLIRAIVLTDDFIKGTFEEFGHEAKTVLDSLANLRGAPAESQLTPAEFEQQLQAP